MVHTCMPNRCLNEDGECNKKFQKPICNDTNRCIKGFENERNSPKYWCTKRKKNIRRKNNRFFIKNKGFINEMIFLDQKQKTKQKWEIYMQQKKPKNVFWWHTGQKHEHTRSRSLTKSNKNKKDNFKVMTIYLFEWKNDKLEVDEFFLMNLRVCVCYVIL